MTVDLLQSRFERELRAALACDGAAPGATMVHVAAPTVHVSPEIKATLPALDGPLPVQDVDAGTYATRLKVVKRDAEGRIDELLITPEVFFPLGSFK